MKRKYKCLAAIFFSLFFAGVCFAQRGGNQGVRLFEQGKAAESIAYLEADIASGKAEPIEYNYLGLAYYQIKNYAKSVEAFRKGTVTMGTNKKLLYFNMGNSYFAMADYQNALDSYSMACVADPGYAEPLLNKANTEIKLDRLSEAAEDYKRYIELCPDSEQREKIEKVLTLIDAELLVRAENAKKMEEENARLKVEEDRLAKERAERERLAAEKRAEEERLAAQRRAEEEERRRKILEEVAASLRQNSETTNMSADAENTLDYDYESDIE